jgi:hypothetical protein
MNNKKLENMWRSDPLPGFYIRLSLYDDDMYLIIRRRNKAVILLYQSRVFIVISNHSYSSSSFTVDPRSYKRL